MNETAYFGAGCFWGVEYYFQRERGVIAVRSGYMGGNVENPTYEQVCGGKTGHIEVVEVVFDPKLTNFEDLCKVFFEIHDFEQENGQGNDIGEQYLSKIFAKGQRQREIAQKILAILENKGYNVVTEVFEAVKFWPAEDYHQDYYGKNGGLPYCHFRQKIF